MTVDEIRSHFLTFFKEKGHTILPSAPIVVKNDPTLMFINAGMNPFKDLFLGNKKVVHHRVANTQKCLRVSGKHNDLEEVGVDTYHHTMFEMLGNWSFGDANHPDKGYFKKEAISWAWELLVDVLKLDTDRLYVTVFKGNKADNLQSDEETYSYWKEYASEDRILYFDKKDNFWEMGDAGPCGPSSEIHIDLRSDEERKKIDGGKLVNQDHPEVIEIWNLVFIQYNRKANGALEELPQKHVDTGMGLERLARVLQQKSSNYDTDIFTPLIQKLEVLSGKKYGVDDQEDIAFRVIADHVRAVSFSIADGQLPSNTGAGYVIRRILRRAVRFGYTFLGFEQPFLPQVFDVLAQQMETVFPELTQQNTLIRNVIKEEESGFFKTLSIGLQKLDDLEVKMREEEKMIIPGEKAFELYDTYGFPIDLTQLIAREKGLQVDVDGFTQSLEQQKQRSKKAEDGAQSDWVIVSDQIESRFVGYHQLTADVSIIKYRKIQRRKKEIYQLVFDQTPFYAEGGGQVGDTGYIESEGEKISIVDTMRENELIVHIVEKLPSDSTQIFKAVVDGAKRANAEKNHSATHLLHHALREILGDHVQQKGSLVESDYLRFDFSHFQKVSVEELQEIELTVNNLVQENISLQEKLSVPIDEAMKMGAMALFGEKYGDSVRVIQFGHSVELCGGTHVQATGQVGLFKIVSESSIAAGIRRIEAITGKKALEYVNQKEEQLNKIAEILKSTQDVVLSTQKLVEENQSLRKKVERAHMEQQKNVKQSLLAKIEPIGDVQAIVEHVEVSNADMLKNISFQLKSEVDNLFLLLGSEINGKAIISLTIHDTLVHEKDLHAGTIIRELAKEIQGGGGGQPFYATAGGKNVDGIEKALKKGREIVQSI